MTRNHRGFLEALFAGARCGARFILMNSGFSGPQVCEVSAREGVDLFVYDEEFEPLIAELELPRGRFRAWSDTRHDAGDTLAALVAAAPSPPRPPKPALAPRLVILTSGTTGTPKGAGRNVPVSLSPIGGPLSKVPFRSRRRHPASRRRCSTRSGSPRPCSRSGSGRRWCCDGGLPGSGRREPRQHRVTTWVIVPVMLRRVLALSPGQWADSDARALRIIYLSGSSSAPIWPRALDRFGPVLYNLYGSTEIAYATIATPADLAAAPGCVGRSVRGAVVKILGPDGEELPLGETGRIFVGQ